MTNKDFCNLLERVNCPAFIAQEGIVAYANEDAQQLGIQAKAKVSSYLKNDDYYSLIKDGHIYTKLQINALEKNVAIERTEKYDIFYLDVNDRLAHLRTLSLAAQVLRGPLSDALNAVETMLITRPKSDVVQNEIPILNRSLHQLQRTICNFADIPDYDVKPTLTYEDSNITKFMYEVTEKAKTVLEQNNITLEYSGLNRPLYCLIDREKIERATLNLISNAIKFREPDTAIHVTLERVNNRIIISVTNSCQSASSIVHSKFFDQYCRSPGIGSTLFGMGLGIPLAQSCATAHGGALLADAPESDKIRVTMTFPIRIKTETTVRSTTLRGADYCGEFDHLLIELSDVLPPTFYL